MCCLTPYASYSAPCQPLLRAFSGLIRSPPPTSAHTIMPIMTHTRPEFGETKITTKWAPHGGERPFHQKSTCLTQLTLGAYWCKFGHVSPRILGERNLRTPPCGLRSGRTATNTQIDGRRHVTGVVRSSIQGYLAHKKTSPPRTLQ